MVKNNSILLARIDERVKTIFNEIKELHGDMANANERHMKCQTEMLPKMMTEIKLLKQRPMGVTAFMFAFLRRII